MSITIRPTTAHHDAPQVNMANGNAAALFDLLGLDFDGDWGETTAADMIGRALLAAGLLNVATDDERGRPGITDSRWTEGGRRPGYLAEKLGQVYRVAEWAQTHGAGVCWS